MQVRLAADEHDLARAERGELGDDAERLVGGELVGARVAGARAAVACTAGRSASVSSQTTYAG